VRTLADGLGTVGRPMGHHTRGRNGKSFRAGPTSVGWYSHSPGGSWADCIFFNPLRKPNRRCWWCLTQNWPPIVSIHYRFDSRNCAPLTTAAGEMLAA
jgi:hypothetical protein